MIIPFIPLTTFAQESSEMQQGVAEKSEKSVKKAKIKRYTGLFKEPSLKGEPFLIIPKGAQVEIIEDKKHFKKVRYKEFTGYVYFTAFLDGKKEESAPSPKIEKTVLEERDSSHMKIEKLDKESKRVDTLSKYREMLEPFSEKLVIQNPDNYHVVRISLKDINKIKCKAKVESFVYSKEKNIEVTVTDSKEYLFVKILPTEIVKKEGDVIVEQHLEYDDSPRELFVECGDKMFSLIMIPQDIPSQIIEIQSTPKVVNIKETESLKEINDFEKYIQEVLLRIYKSKRPEESGFEIKEYDFKRSFKELDLIGQRVYFVENYIVKEIMVVAKEKIDPLSEYIFLNIAKLPVAIMLTKHKLERNEVGILYIVEKNN